MSNEIIEHYKKEFEAFRSILWSDESQWISGFRHKAMGHFTRMGLPNKRNEEWKYTDVSDLESRFFKPSVEASEADPDLSSLIKELSDDSVLTLVFQNGHWLSLETGFYSPPPGITITSLGKMLVDFPDRVQQHLAPMKLDDNNAFLSLNAAFMTDGAYIRIDKNTRVEKPIQMLFITTDTRTPPVTQPKNLVILEEGAEAFLMERYLATGHKNEYITNTATDIVLGRNSVLEYVNLQEEGENAYHLSTTRITQLSDSRLISHDIAMGGHLSRKEISVQLEEEGAECALNGLYLGTRQQHLDHHTRIDHKNPNCASHELYKGVLTESSRGVFNGKIIVHPGARQTKAYQLNSNLLLSSEAEIDSKPQLEIFADDVKCSHGSTIGQLDKEALFFLRSRGLSEIEAKNLLVHGFAKDILLRISHDPLRESILSNLVNKLPYTSEKLEIN